MELIKRIASFVLAGAVALGVIIGAISWFQMSPEDRSEAMTGIGRVLAWVGIAAILPWATYFITTAVAKKESNALGMILVAGYTLIDAAVLFWLLGFSHNSTLAISMITLGLLVVLTYNLLTCDWIAEKMG